MPFVKIEICFYIERMKEEHPEPCKKAMDDPLDEIITKLSLVCPESITYIFGI